MDDLSLYLAAGPRHVRVHDTAGAVDIPVFTDPNPHVAESASAHDTATVRKLHSGVWVNMLGEPFIADGSTYTFDNTGY